MSDIIDLSWLEFSAGDGCSIDGQYLKAVDKARGLWYKLSKFNPVDGCIGLESVYESICSDLAREYGLESLGYECGRCLFRFEGKRYEADYCVSEDYKKGRETVSLETALCMSGLGVWDFISVYGLGEYVLSLLQFDYIIANRDRHCRNLEFYMTDGKFIPVPIFDNGMSLIQATVNSKEMWFMSSYSFEFLINNFLGIKSTGSILNVKGILGRCYIRELSKDCIRSIVNRYLGMLEGWMVGMLSDFIYERQCRLFRQIGKTGNSQIERLYNKN